MVASTTSFSVMLAAAMLAANVYAHGYMSDPAVTFVSTNDPTQFICHDRGVCFGAHLYIFAKQTKNP
ncbi:hypothetical protein PI125_g10428 [Phytophthora idaei]|nr:hypothetical protein PI125_g10428 [Phytophthora idaei]